MRIWVDPDATLSEIAGDIGVKERAVYLIVRDLVEAGFIQKEKVGRRNRYQVNLEHALDYRPIPHTSIREQIMGIALTLGMRLPEGAGSANGGRRTRVTAAASR
jgi:DNA-binding Lrp family transcriptional regulator